MSRRRNARRSLNKPVWWTVSPPVCCRRRSLKNKEGLDHICWFVAWPAVSGVGTTGTHVCSEGIFDAGDLEETQAKLQKGGMLYSEEERRTRLLVYGPRATRRTAAASFNPLVLIFFFCFCIFHLSVGIHLPLLLHA